ncbi:hypothetical protein ACFO3D_01695 [Virgibacillus kekensis]|uniref:Lipoprotein n=1 Tax=Virgibacillus kekensis TaxID=202261 RepID=A0ABV9DDP2_9BACI
MFKRTMVLGLMLFLVACANEQTIMKNESPPKDPQQNPEIVEQEDKDKEEVNQFIKFTLPDEQLMINLEMVPILNAYLIASPNREQTIREMNMKPVSANEREYYLLEFSCDNDLCSYLFMNQAADKSQAYLVADMAKLVETEVSPENNRIMFHFNREQKNLSVPFSDIAVIDLENWEMASIKNETDDNNRLDFEWQTVTADWADNETITALQPALMEPTPESFKRWQKNGKPTEEVLFTLND